MYRPNIPRTERKSIAVKKSNRYMLFSGGLFMSFVIFTVLVSVLDVRTIGPEGSEIGLAAINSFLHQKIGVHMLWYHITDWLGVIALLTALGFAGLGLYQLLGRKSIRRVDKGILSLGYIYVLLLAFYWFFEQVIINVRPVLMEGVLEASYPSSHTMLVVCVMATAAKALRTLWPERKRLCLGAGIFCPLLVGITIFGRLVSGVHWFTDIVGSVLLAASLVILYSAMLERQKEKG